MSTEMLMDVGPAMEERPAAARPKPQTQPYDFRHPHRVSKERLRTVEAMYDRLVRSLEAWLVGRVRGKVELRLLGVDELGYGEFAGSLPTPCTAYIFTIQGASGQKGVVELGRDFAYFLVDRLFGGGGTPKVLNRALTPIERMAVRMVAERTLVLLTEVWQDHFHLDMKLTGFESIPDILQAENRDEPMLVARVEVNIQGMSSGLSVCLPLTVFEQFLAGGAQRRMESVGVSDRERQSSRERAEHSLRATEVTVAARLPEFPLTMRELAALREGSVLLTGIPTDSELNLLVNNQPRFTAAAGRSGSRLAVRVLDTIGNGVESTALALIQSNE